MSNPSDDAAIDKLRSNVSNLSPSDQVRAASLIDQYDRWRLSPRQWALVQVLARLAAPAPSVRVQTQVGDLSALNALFDRAGDRLKSPTLVFGDNAGGEYRVKVARGRARFPGSLDVTTPDTLTWYGRVLVSGVFEASPRVATPPALPAALVAFARNPAWFAGAHAKATGRCMFCGLRIGEGDDPRARSVGYGETCAATWGQPFPSKAKAIVSNTALIAGAQP